ncbi:kinase-like domain-containing protein [Astrocystis sublimbata]|nr:kinase-like domain-containing protein [Astrocystis sublimbata]
MTHNHSNFRARLELVQEVLEAQFGTQVNPQIIPIQYDPECPFKYNNFVYQVTLPSPVSTNNVAKLNILQSGCVPIPDGTKEVIMRLTNLDAEGLSRQTRVENEVAMMRLAANALGSFKPPVVPRVYAWGSASVSQGWILQELMPGKHVDEAFGAMTRQQKQTILSQMAELLGSLQSYQLPDSITGYGGVMFDEDSRVVSAAMTSVGAGPWPTYEASFKGRLQVALQRADANPYIQGWHANGIRNRLENFVKHGLATQFDSLAEVCGKAIVHADFTTNNLLFDPATYRITALVDFDFACIMHPSYEFLRSFDGVGGQFRGWSDDEASEDAVLRHAKLHGFPSLLPTPAENGIDWEVAKDWEDELEALDIKRPRTIVGIDKVADVDSILRTILPWRVSNSDILRLQSEEVIIKCKEKNEQQLVHLLRRLGF